MNRGRQLVRVALEQLCTTVDNSGTERPLTRQAASVLVAMVRQVLERQLDLELPLLDSMEFPAMSELRNRHRALLWKLRDLEGILERGERGGSLLEAARRLDEDALEYFDWMDAFFCKATREPH